MSALAAVWQEIGGESYGAGSSPVVANGWLYCSDRRGVLTGFSL
jgi:hypothetical protein